jgi:hypothetical protein
MPPSAQGSPEGANDRAPASAAPPPTRKRRASIWGWIAAVAAVVSAIGYALQIILDWVPEPAAIGFGVFWGLFAGDAVVGLLAGLVAVAQGWRHPDETIRFGLVGIGWFVLAQTIQSIWD